jgi:hypothetical protein
VAVIAASVLASNTPAAAAPSLTTGESILAPLLVRSSIHIDGVGCGRRAMTTATLPAGAVGVHVRRPARGAETFDARVTAVAVRGTVVTITAVGAGKEICDPAAASAPPPSRSWSAAFDLEVTFERREMVAVAAHWRLRDGLVVRPSLVALSQYTSNATNTVQKIRWKQFGGRTAIGLGIYKAAPFFCPSAARCILENGQPVRVELSRPAYCPGDNMLQPGRQRIEPFVFYGRVKAFFLRPFGAIKPGPASYDGYEADKFQCLGARRIP